MKKVLSILLIGVLVIALAACGKSIGTGNKEKESESKIEVVKEKETTKKDEKETTKKKDEKETTSAAQQSGDDSYQEQGGDNGGYYGGDNNGNYSGGGGYNGGGGNTQTPTQPQTQAPKPAYTISVTVSGEAYGGYFGGGTFSYEYPPTAFDALVSTGLSYNGDRNYVRGINGLSEFDHGPLSGWLYAVNGVTPGVSCGDYYLQDGDSVSWFYQGDE
ncbi:MAG: DUF4430 domain-containing protein [Parasporobacterium sp.]|nr:DUF4430 domain-containing protein [Parasporobacterium sp.]